MSLCAYGEVENTDEQIEETPVARMFGINSISLWRIGAIPNGSSEQHMGHLEYYRSNEIKLMKN